MCMLKSMLKVCCIFEPSADYITNVQDDGFSEGDRNGTVLWMSEICRHSWQDVKTALSAINIFDRFLSKVKIIPSKLKVVGAACVIIVSRRAISIDQMVQYNNRIPRDSYSEADLTFWVRTIESTLCDLKGVLAMDIVYLLLDKIRLEESVKIVIINLVKQELLERYENYYYLGYCVKTLVYTCLNISFSIYSIPYPYCQKYERENFDENKSDIYSRPLLEMLGIDNKTFEFRLAYRNIEECDNLCWN